MTRLALMHRRNHLDLGDPGFPQPPARRVRGQEGDGLVIKGYVIDRADVEAIELLASLPGTPPASPGLHG